MRFSLLKHYVYLISEKRYVLLFFHALIISLFFLVLILNEKLMKQIILNYMVNSFILSLNTDEVKTHPVFWKFCLSTSSCVFLPV